MTKSEFQLLQNDASTAVEFLKVLADGEADAAKRNAVLNCAISVCSLSTGFSRLFSEYVEKVSKLTDVSSAFLMLAGGKLL